MHPGEGPAGGPAAGRKPAQARQLLLLMQPAEQQGCRATGLGLHAPAVHRPVQICLLYGAQLQGLHFLQRLACRVLSGAGLHPQLGWIDAVAGRVLTVQGGTPRLAVFAFFCTLQQALPPVLHT